MKATYIQYTLVSTLLLLLLSACQNEIDYKGGVSNPRLVMNALLNADTLVNKLFLNLSGNQGTPEVKDALVHLYVNDELKETLPYIRRELNDPTGYYLITTPFAEEDKVRIEATSSDGVHRVYAEVVVPQRIDIQRIDTATITQLESYSNNSEVIRLKIALNDRVNEKNYYQLGIKQNYITRGSSYWEEKDTIFTRSEIAFESSFDMALSDGKPISEAEIENGLFPTVRNQYGIFDDTYFKDKSYTLTVYTTIFEDYYPYVEILKSETLAYDVSLKCITKEQYYYLRAMNILDSDGFDPIMSQPVQMPSNVIGGLGFVGMQASTTQTETIR